jgi:hypothetical protein
MGDEDFWLDAQPERGEVARGAHIDVDAGGNQAAAGGQPSRAEGCATRSCSLSVLMEEAAEKVASVYIALIIFPQGGQLGRRLWRLQQQRPVGTVAVVMLDDTEIAGR